jgi:hypothetical protein
VTEDILFKWWVLLEEGRKDGRTFSQPDRSSPPPRCITGLTVDAGERGLKNPMA